MHGIAQTKHFERRFQQRGLTSLVVETLLKYGAESRTRGGAERLTFNKEVLADIRSDLGPQVYKACERLKNAYLVISDDGIMVTVARSYRKATQ